MLACVSFLELNVMFTKFSPINWPVGRKSRPKGSVLVNSSHSNTGEVINCIRESALTYKMSVNHKFLHKHAHKNES